MKYSCRKRFALVLLFIFIFIGARGQFYNRELKLYDTDSVFSRKNYIRSGIEGVCLNVGVWAFDYYILKADFAKISAATVRNNFKVGMVWDNDNIATNLFYHPYTGALYFSAARANNLNFWQSLPYSLAGSLIWEFFFENEPPSINDFQATGIGGAFFGEVLHRLSELPINPYSRGWNRFFREAATFLISPTHGINRLVTGEAWAHPAGALSYKEVPFKASIYLGNRYLSMHNRFPRGHHVPSLFISTLYGDPYDGDFSKPFSYFSLKATLSFPTKQPIISSVSMTGIMWGRSYETQRENFLTWGIFQHFNFLDSDPLEAGSDVTPYRLGIPVSLGVGLLYSTKPARWQFDTRIYASGVLLGGIISDHFTNIDRDYNLGNGFSSRLEAKLKYKDRLLFSFDVYQYWIYSTKGFEGEPDGNVSYDDLYLNTKGNTSVGNMLIGSLSIEYAFSKWVKLFLQELYYHRYTQYEYFPDVKTQTFESRIGLGFMF